MKREDIKRIAEIIGVEPMCVNGQHFIYLGKGRDNMDGRFRPHANWAHTGMLLEWLHSYCNSNGYDLGISGFQVCIGHYVAHCDEVDDWETVVLTEPFETLQLAICNAVLSL